MQVWTPEQGAPEGAVLSPLLSNIYLDPLDHLMARSGFEMVRYADDFVILCRTADDAARALELVRQWVAGNGLTLHPTKTHVGDCRVPGQGFEFLGYRFEAGKRLVRKKSLDKLKDTIREKTGRNRGDSLECVIADLNRDPARLVRLLQACPPVHLPIHRRIGPASAALSAAETADEAVAHRSSEPRSQSAVAQCLLRGARAVRTSRRPGPLRDSLDEETTDWRAVCGKTARTVRRAGRAKTLPDPYPVHLSAGTAMGGANRCNTG